MGIVKTLSRVLLGFVLACLVAGLVQVLYVSSPVEIAASPAAELPQRTGGVLELALLAATHSAIFSAAFALIIAGIFEWLSLKTIVHSLAAGMGIALLGFFAQYSSEVSGQPTIFNNYALQAYLTAGFFAGLMYWVVAGRYSGSRREVMAADAPGLSAEGSPRTRVIVEKASGELKKGSLAERLANRKAALASGAASVMTSVPAIRAKSPAETKAAGAEDLAKTSVAATPAAGGKSSAATPAPVAEASASKAKPQAPDKQEAKRGEPGEAKA